MFKLKRKFELRAPSPQTPVDIFAGRWATDLSRLAPVSGTGQADLSRDPRIDYVVRRFGPLDGLRVLELGPLEGAHTCALERMGAAVTAVEANAEAYLKCLIVKELAGLSRARFLHGDFVEHLKSDAAGYDLVLASGVLYHMDDPAELIRLMALRAPRVFIWTHVYAPQAWKSARPRRVVREGLELTYHQRTYRRRGKGTFWGGVRETACLLTREDLLGLLTHHGFTNVEIHREQPDHPRGPCLSLTACCA